ncbi:MAG: SDR family oxidoreductase, partial [Alphaproteobacteria bacterium]|nr:SDR family oxidoreductase [Alphaproteobacteria bacterium]
GRALAEGLAGAGAEILINGRDTEALGAAAADLASKGARVKALAFDVTSEDSVAAAVDHAEREIGPIDILVNNAGMQKRAPIEDFPLDAFETLMRTNVTSAFITAKAVARHMIGRGAGRIVNICSINTLLARPSITPYTASKGALANLTKGMATEWGPKGLTVNGLAPGYVRTELTANLVADAAFSAWLCERTPLGRWGEVEDLVGAAVFLCSEASRFVNGHILYVDGGLTARV